MERNNLSRALPALYDAERLLAEAEAWVAQQLMAGLCEACLGVVLLVQRRIVVGAWHVLKAYAALRHLSISSLLSFEGMESPVVRSLALYFLGTKALIVGLVPPAVVRWFPGFSGSGDREGGLAMLRKCVTEGDLLADYARDTLLVYHIAIKELYQLDWTDADWWEVDALCAAFDERHGRASMISGPKIAAVHGWRREPRRGLERVREVAADDNVARLPVLRSMMLMEQCNYHLALLEWDEAAECARAALRLCEAKGKRGGMPALCGMIARLCCADGNEAGWEEMRTRALTLKAAGEGRGGGDEAGGDKGAAGEDDDEGEEDDEAAFAAAAAEGGDAAALAAAAEAKALTAAPRTPTLPPRAQRRRRRKTKWSLPDQNTFLYFVESSAMGGEARRCDALHRLVFQMWGSNALTYLGATDATTLIGRLEDVAEGLHASFACQSRACCAMVALQQAVSAPTRAERDRMAEEALRYCSQGVVIEHGVRGCAEERGFALAMQLHYLAAVAHVRRGRLLAARAAVREAEAAPKGTKPIAVAIAQYLVPLLSRQLRVRIDAECQSLTVAAGASQRVEVPVCGGKRVEWEWAIERGAAVSVAAAGVMRGGGGGAQEVEEALGKTRKGGEAPAAGDVGYGTWLARGSGGAATAADGSGEQDACGSLLRLSFANEAAAGWVRRGTASTVWRVVEI